MRGWWNPGYQSAENETKQPVLCDRYGTHPCNSDEIHCFNEGTCVLKLSDVINECYPVCKCPPAFMGTYCEFNGAYYANTVGTIIGVFLLVMLLIFLVIAIWCCIRKKRTMANQAQNMDTMKEGTNVRSNVSWTPTGRHKPHGQEYTNWTTIEPQQQKPSTLHSYSLYDNVNEVDLGEEELQVEQQRIDHVSREPVHFSTKSQAMRETAHLLAFEGVDGRPPATQQVSSEPDTTVQS